MVGICSVVVHIICCGWGAFGVRRGSGRLGRPNVCFMVFFAAFCGFAGPFWHYHPG